MPKQRGKTALEVSHQYKCGLAHPDRGSSLSQLVNVHKLSLLTLFILTLLVLLPLLVHGLSTDKYVYTINETIRIDTQGGLIDGRQLLVRTPLTTITYLGSQPVAYFTPQELGSYALSIVDIATQQALENVVVEVVQSTVPNATAEPQAIETSLLRVTEVLVGTRVVINISELPLVDSLELSTTGATYQLLELGDDVVYFTPQTAGEYIVTARLSSGEEVQDSFIAITGAQPVPPRLSLDQATYEVGSSVTIDFLHLDNTDYVVDIYSPLATYKFRRVAEHKLTFTPDHPGAYTSQLSKDGQVFDEVTFEVQESSTPPISEPEPSTEDPSANGSSTLNDVIDAVGRGVSAIGQTISEQTSPRIGNISDSVKLVRHNGREERNITINVKQRQGLFGKAALRANQRYEVEIDFPYKSVKRLQFTDLRVEQQAQFLGVEEVAPTTVQDDLENVGSIVQSYAIDPTQVNFTRATMTVQAAGSELYKCKLWNYSQQRCFGTWDRVRFLTPGQEYNLTITPDDPGFAESLGKARRVALPYTTTAGQSVNTAVAVNFDSHTIVDTTYTHSEVTDNSRLTINEDGYYKVSYGCGVLHTGGGNARDIIAHYVREGGTNEIVPSRTHCYIRRSTNDQNRCSNSATFFANLTSGQYLELIGERVGGAQDAETHNHCWMYADKITYPVAQKYDNNGGQNFEGTIITVDLEGNTYVDPDFFGEPPDAINVTENGMYKIAYHVCSDNTAQANRFTPRTWLRINGTTNLTPSFLYSYIRGTGADQDRECETANVLAHLVHGESIEMRHDKQAQESAGASVILADMSWLFIEKIPDDAYFQMYQISGAQTVAENNEAAVTFGTNQHTSPPFSHTVGTSAVTVNEAGVYEVAYTIGVNDGLAGGRHIMCTWLTLSGTKVEPSAMCSYGPRDHSSDSNHVNTISAQVVLNITAGQTVEVYLNATGGGLTIEDESSWLNIVGLRRLARPNVTNLTHPPDSVSFNITPIDFNFTVIDIDSPLSNCSLYINSTGSFHDNITMFTPVNNSENNITASFIDGTYEWNVLCRDVDSATDFHDTNFTALVDLVPDISGTVENDGPVDVGERLTFNATCTNPGDVFRLIVCNSSVSVCSPDTDPDFIICEGPNNDTAEAVCSFFPTEDQGGTHVGDVATCCDDNNQCDPVSVSVDTWVVRSPPSITVTATDYGSSATTPTQAGSIVRFNVTATDPNGDDYYILVCPTNETNPGQGDCEFGQNRYCFASSSPSNSGEHSSCDYTTVADTDSGNLSWHVFACDDQVAPNILCSSPDNGTGITGSPFYVNNPPDLSEIARNASYAKVGDTINITSLDASDQESDHLKIQCGSSSGVYNLCEGDVGSPQVDCAFSSPFTDNIAHTIFCVVNDSRSISAEISTSYIADNRAPNVTSPAINDSDFVVQLLDSIQFNVTVVDLGSGIINTSIGNDTQREMTFFGANDVFQLNATPASLGCTAQDGPCDIHILSIDNVSLLNNSVNFTLTIDNVAPSVTNVELNDTDRIMQSSATIGVNVTVADTNTINSVTVENESSVAMSQLGAKWTATTTPNALGCTAQDGTCNLTFVATDVVNNVNDSVVYGITIDNLNPNVFNPEFNDSDRVMRSTDIFALNITVTDTNTVVNVTVYNESEVQMVQIESSTKWTVNVTPQQLGCVGEDNICNLTFVATDVAGNVNSTVHTSIRVDNLNPQVSNPEFNDTDRIVRSTDTFELNITVTDTNTITSVAVINESSVAMLSILLTDKWTVDTTGAALGCVAEDDLCNLTFVATDAAGNVNNTVHTSIRIDDVPPQLFSIQINDSDNIFTSGQSFQLNITVTDTNAVVNVTVENDSIVQMVQFPSSTKWTVNTSAQDLSCTTNGICNLTFTGTDVAGNRNNTVVYGILVDNGPPSVTSLLINDSDNVTESTVDVNLSVTVVDGSGVTSVTVNGTALTQLDTVWTYIGPLSTLGCAEPTCTLGINASDVLGNYNDSETINVTIDDNFPQLVLEKPDDYFATAETTLDLNFTVTDTVAAVLTCNVTLDGAIANSPEIIAVSGALTQHEETGISEGNHTWSVTCRDDIPHYNFSESRIFVVDLTPPAVNISTPINSTEETSDNTITFVYNVTDFLSDVSSCILILNNEQSGLADGTITENETQSFVRVVSNGDYNWSVNCTDAVGLVGSSPYHNLTVFVQGDDSAPLVSLNEPSDNAYQQDTTINFTYTPTDSTGILNCTLSIDGVDNATCGDPGQIDDGFINRTRFTITENSGETLTEYQFNLTVDTYTLIEEGWMKNDCSDILFTDSTGQEIPYFVDHYPNGCNNESTRIWVRLDSLSASSSDDIFMYFNNPKAGSRSDKFAVFNFSTPQPIMWVIDDISPAQASIQVVSMVDDNTVEIGPTSASLNTYDTTSFSNTLITQGSSINSTRPFGSWGTYSGVESMDAALVPISFAATHFVYRIDRGTSNFHLYAPFGDADVEIRSGSGFSTLLTSTTVTQGTAVTTTDDPANDVTVLINVTNNVPILAMHSESASTDDAFIMHPPAKDWWGSTSNNIDIGILHDNTNVTVYFSDGSVTYQTVTLNGGDEYRISTIPADGGTGGDMDEATARVVANQSIGVVQIADNDGSEATTFLPYHQLDTEYYVYTNYEYISITTTEPSTSCSIMDNTDTVRSSGTSDTDGRPFPGRLYFGADEQSTNTGPVKVNCSHPVMVQFEPFVASNGEESNTWNAKQFRKYVWPPPSYSTEESTELNISYCDIVTGGVNNFTVSGFNDGTYVWNITCYDNSSNKNVGYSVTRNVTVDTTPPTTISLVSPSNDTISSTTNPTFQWTQTTEVNFANYTLEVSDDPSFPYLNTTAVILDRTDTDQILSLAVDSTYYWRVIAFDLASNNFTTPFFVYTTDNTNPSVTLLSPGDNTWNNSVNLDFSYVATDTHLKNCTLYTNFSQTFDPVDENITVASGITDIFDTIAVSDGIYVWNVGCYDNASNFAFADSNFTIRVDQIPPTIALDQPDDLFNSSSSSVTLRFTPADNLAFSFTCNVTIDGVVNETDVSVASESQEIVNIAGLNDGNHTWNVSCTDLAGNTNFSDTRRFTVDTVAPVVELESPSNDTIFNLEQLITFEYNVTDVTSSIENCSLYINEVFNQSDQSITAGTTQTFSSYLTSGQYNWSVVCVDNLLNQGSSVNFTLTVAPPKYIYPFEPANGTIIDRDRVSDTTEDNATLRISLSDTAEGELISFYANLTDPIIADQSNILLGQSRSNATGIAELNFSGRNNLGSKMFAGAYEWWAEGTNYLQNGTRTVQIWGGLNLTFRFERELPDPLYGPAQNASIQMFLKSFGPESDGEINGTYLASVNATLLAQNGTNETIALIDPPIWDYGPWVGEDYASSNVQESSDLSNDYSNLMTYEISVQEQVWSTAPASTETDQLRIAAAETGRHQQKETKIERSLDPFIASSSDSRIDSRLQFINNETNYSYETPGATRRLLQRIGLARVPTLNTSNYTVVLEPEDLPVKSIEFNDLQFNGSFSLGLESVDKELVVENKSAIQSYAIDPSQLHFTEATVTVTAKGTALHKCTQWDFASQTCLGEWKQILRTIPGQNYTITITPDDPGFAETNLTILNLQSYPVVGGDWLVQFETQGSANLTIRGINGTTLSQSGNGTDLRFDLITCGGVAVPAIVTYNQIIVPNYSCTDVSIEKSKVQTPGVHILEFQFGDSVGYARNLAAQDFYVQRNTVTTTGTTATITEGSDYTLYPGATTSNTFIRLTNTRKTGMGEISTGGGQTLDTYTFRIDNPENVLTSVTFTKTTATAIAQRLEYEVIQYIGPSGGANEFIVRDTGDISTTGLNAAGATITDIDDVNKVAVFITGQSTDNTGTSLWQNALFTSNISEDGADHVPEFRRGDATSTGFVSYAVVEFIGSNWRDVQRVEFTSADHGATAWTTGSPGPSGTFAIPTTLLNVNKTFLHQLYRIEAGGTQGLDDAGENVELNLSHTDFTTRRKTATGATGKYNVVWVMENTQDGAGEMRVQHVSYYEPDITSPEEKTYTITIDTVDQLNSTSIMSEAASTDGTGTAYPRGSANVRLTAVNQVSWTVSDSGQEEQRSFSVVQWPTAPRIPPNVTLVAPGNNTRNTSRSINFTYLPQAFSNFTDCTLYNDDGGWSAKETNLSGISNNTRQTLNDTFSQDGTFLWNVECTTDHEVPAFEEHNFTIRIDAAPTISGVITNNGPVDEGDDITFTGTCANLGDNFHLIVCNASVSTCNLATPVQDVVCNGTLGTVTTPQCVLTTNASMAGNHSGDIGACCDDSGQCTESAVSANHWIVRGAPVITINGSDQGSDVLTPTAAEAPVNFTVTAVDPNGDATYKLLVCNVSTTPSGPATCAGGSENELCSAFATNGSQASCEFTDTAGLSGNYSWHVFVCDSALCSSQNNGTGVNGSPFYINNNATMLNVTANQYVAALSDTITLTSFTASDQEDNQMRLQCGNESTGPFDTVCAGTYGTGERSCTFSFPYGDNSPHTFYCVLNDTFSISATNTSVIIADNGAPSVVLNQPANATFALTSSVQFNYTPADSQLEACVLYGNFTSPAFSINETDSSPTSGTKNSFPFNDLQDGRYLWNVICNDTVSNEAFAPDNFTVIVDTTEPTVTLSSPLDDAVEESSNTVDFTFEVLDVGANVTLCSLIVNGTVNGTVTDPEEGNPNVIIQSFLPDGVYNWTVNCSDFNGYVGIAPEVRDLTLAVANAVPTITLDYPDDNAYVSGLNIDLLYTPSDDKGLANCSLYLYEEFNRTDDSITQNVQTNFTVNSTTETKYNWSVTCEDNIGQTVSSGIRTFFVDRTNPEVNLVSPPNASTYTDSDRVPFRYNVTDNSGAPLANCSLFINDAETTEVQTSVPLNDTQTLLVTLDNQRLYWSVQCVDQAGNLDISDVNFNLTVNASLKLWNNTFNLSDNFEDIWKVNAYAGANYFFPVVLEDTRNLTLDLSPPNITLLAPANNSNTTEQVVDLSFNATDLFTNVTECTLYVDNVSVFTNSSIEQITTNITHNFSFGVHTWIIECVDYVGNRGNSTEFILNVQFRDLFTNDSYMTANDLTPIDGQLVQVNATIFNLGTQDIEDNFFVEFTDITPLGTTTINTVLVTGLDKESNTTVNVTWRASRGNHTIQASLDSTDVIDEANETNNIGQLDFFISSYQLFFGNISGDILLSSNTSSSFVDWKFGQQLLANVFIADADSSISFVDIHALGRNLSLNETFDDFAELDLGLNMTNYTDSINRTYTFDEQVKSTINLSLYDSVTYYIPVVNSTNTTEFVTGILWDGSDTNTGQYNGSQDVVFVTQTSLNQLGEQGISDFEINVPATLESYVVPDTLDSLTFYIELT